MHLLPAGASLLLTSKDGRVTLALSTTPGHLSTPPLKPLQLLALKLRLPDLQLLILQLPTLHFLDLQLLAGPADTGPPAPGPPALRRKRGTG